MIFEKELNSIATVSNGFKPMENLANEAAQTLSKAELTELAYHLYESEIYQIRIVAVFLFGRLSSTDLNILQFMKQQVSLDTNWRVQEILAMAFDNYCKDIGYKKALATIKEWINHNNSNVRRAVSEGLRIWTSRPYFKQHPDIAIQLLVQLRCDNSDYVRKSCGNALRDISKKHPDLILEEIATWKNTKEEEQVKKIIMKNKNLAVLLK